MRERGSRSRSLSLRMELRAARRTSRLADEVLQFWNSVNEYDGHLAREVQTLYRRLKGREAFSQEQVENFANRADFCTREVSRLELLVAYRRAHQQEEVRLRGELRQVGQPNGGRPASPGGEERSRSELHRRVSEVRRPVEEVRRREEVAEVPARDAAARRDVGPARGASSREAHLRLRSS